MAWPPSNASMESAALGLNQAAPENTIKAVARQASLRSAFSRGARKQHVHELGRKQVVALKCWSSVKHHCSVVVSSFV